MKGHYAAEKFQSEAYAWLAVAVAPRDKARAATLIERALDITSDQPQEFQSWTYFGGGAGEAGWTVACAKRAGYADMASAVFRVLAARGADRYRDPSMDAECQTIAAAILALTDPKAASQMLRDLELRWGQPRNELGRVIGRRWLMAWALADPSHAEQLFENEFSALEQRAQRTTSVNRHLQDGRDPRATAAAPRGVSPERDRRDLVSGDRSVSPLSSIRHWVSSGGPTWRGARPDRGMIGRVMLSGPRTGAFYVQRRAPTGQRPRVRNGDRPSSAG